MICTVLESAFNPNTPYSFSQLAATWTHVPSTLALEGMCLGHN